MTAKDWHAWHDQYDDPGSNLSQRLAVVQRRIQHALDSCPPGPLRVVSICAGQARDLLGVLATHPRARDVTARLVELDPRNAASAMQGVVASGLRGIEVVVGDAALTDHYADAVPADLVLACGLFGNITDADIERTIGYFPALCQRDGTVLWTRHRHAPDAVPMMCRWFGQRGFELAFVTDPGMAFGVGAHRFTGVPQPLETGRRMFTFIGRERLRQLGLSSS